jgi:hypothetical protein
VSRLQRRINPTKEATSKGEVYLDRVNQQEKGATEGFTPKERPTGSTG